MIVGTSNLTDVLTRVSRAAENVRGNNLRYAWHQIDDKANSIVFITLRDDKLTFFCTSDEMFAMGSIPVELEDGDTDFDAYVFPHLILDHLKFMDGEIKIYKTNKSIMISKGSGKQKIRIVDKQEFSEFFDGVGDPFTEVTGTIPVIVSALTLKDAIQKTEYIAHGKGARSQVILFKSIDKELCVGATDGFRASTVGNLAHCSYDIDNAIFANTATNLVRMLSGEDGDIKMYFTNRGVYIKDGDFIAGTLSTKDAHDIWGLFEKHPRPDKIIFEVDSDILGRALKVTSDIAGQGSGRIIITVTEDDVIIYAESQEVGWSRWGMNPLSVKADGETKIALNPEFISQYVGRARPKTVRFLVSESEKPVYMECEDESLKTLCMPMTIS